MIVTPIAAVATVLVLLKPTTYAKSDHDRPRLVTQVHLAQGVTSATMTVSWVTPSLSSQTNMPSMKPTLLNHIADVKSKSSSLREKADGPREKLAASERSFLDVKELLERDQGNEVRYSTVASSLHLSAVGYSTSYEFNYRRHENYTSGLLHHTSLTNLLPSTIYYYQCGDFSTGSYRHVSGI